MTCLLLVPRALHRRLADLQLKSLHQFQVLHRAAARRHHFSIGRINLCSSDPRPLRDRPPRLLLSLQNITPQVSGLGVDPLIQVKVHMDLTISELMSREPRYQCNRHIQTAGPLRAINWA